MPQESYLRLMLFKVQGSLSTLRQPPLTHDKLAVLAHDILPEFAQADAVTALESYINTAMVLDSYTTQDSNSRILEILSLHKQADLFRQKYGMGLKSAENSAQEAFQVELWAKMLALMEAELELAKQRYDNQTDLAQRMPSLETLQALQALNLLLSQMWYGQDSGNHSIIYKYFVEYCVACGIQFFDVNRLRHQLSQDKMCATLDQKRRAKLCKEYIDSIKKTFALSGGLIESGEQTIDVLNLNNLMPSQYAHKILIRNFYKSFYIRHKHPNLKNWGQLPTQEKIDFIQHIDRCLEKHLQHSEIPYFFLSLMEECQRFECDLAFFARELDLADQDLSRQEVIRHLKLLGIASGHLCLIKRSLLNDMNIHRYLILPWLRQLSLHSVEGSMKKVCLRKSQTHEFSRIRVNQMPYLLYHTISLSSSGYLEGVHDSKSLAYEWNDQQDAQAFLSNEAKDLEKLFHDVVALMPRGPREQLLPEEAFYSGMQNPRWNSSIRHTQHIHLFRASIKDAPFFQRTNQLQAMPANAGLFDLLPLGLKPEAVALVFHFKPHEYEAVLAHAQEFILVGQQVFADLIDFVTYLFPDETGSLTLLLIPQSHLQKLDDGSLLNQETGQTMRGSVSPIITVTAHLTEGLDCPKQGYEALQQFYDFAAKEHLSQLLSKVRFITDSLR